MAGVPLGGDVGYGEARLHDVASAREFGRFLEAQNLEALVARVDIGEMRRRRVYAMPGGPLSEAQFESDLRESVRHSFPRLRDYVRGMSDKGCGLLTWVS